MIFVSALLGIFKQERALVGAFPVIVKSSRRFAVSCTPYQTYIGPETVRGSHRAAKNTPPSKCMNLKTTKTV